MDNSDDSGAASFAGTAFFDKTYKETLSLVEDACAYMEGPAKAERAEFEPRASLNLTAATLHLTSRLTQVMAWMYAQKAYHGGEIGRDKMLAKHRLGARQDALDQSLMAHSTTMPPGLDDLLQRTERLYQRIARLDDMIAGGQA